MSGTGILTGGQFSAASGGLPGKAPQDREAQGSHDTCGNAPVPFTRNLWPAGCGESDHLCLSPRGCCNRLLQTGWLLNHTHQVLMVWRWKSKVRAPAEFVLGGHFLPHSHVLAMLSHRGGARELSGALL